ncbi:MAG: hypothetical protein R6U55_02010 [Desulfovermiculus sp.]
MNQDIGGHFPENGVPDADALVPLQIKAGGGTGGTYATVQGGIAMAGMQRRIQRLEEQTQQKNRDQGGFSRASATLLVVILHMNEDLSSEEREAKIQEQWCRR